MKSMGIKKQKDYLDCQISSIFKAVNLQEVPVKEKHVRAIIIGSYVDIGGEVFWNVVMENMPLQGNQIVCWKFNYVLYKLLRDGHPNIIKNSYKYKNRIKDLGRLWNHLKDEFSALIYNFCTLLAYKIDFHYKNPYFSNTLNIEFNKLDKFYINNDLYFQLATEILDYLDVICQLQLAIFQSLEQNNFNSLTFVGQCRVQPLIPCIQESVLLYDHAVTILYKLHSSIDPEFLSGHRDRFVKIFNSLKIFFEKSLRLQYLKNLVAIPQLNQPPNFLNKRFKPTSQSCQSTSTSLKNVESFEMPTLYEQSKIIASRHPTLPQNEDESFYATLLRESKLLASGDLSGPQYEKILASLNSDEPRRNVSTTTIKTNQECPVKEKSFSNLELLSDILGSSSNSNKNQSLTYGEKGEEDEYLGRCSPDSTVTRQVFFETDSVNSNNDYHEPIEPYFHNGISPKTFNLGFHKGSLSLSSDFDDNTSEDTLSNVTSIPYQDINIPNLCTPSLSRADSLRDSWTNTEKDFKFSLYGTTYEDVIQKAHKFKNLETKNEALKSSLENSKARYETLKHMFENLRNSHYELLKNIKYEKKEEVGQTTDETDNVKTSLTFSIPYILCKITTSLIYELLNGFDSFTNLKIDLAESNLPDANLYKDVIQSIILLTKSTTQLKTNLAVISVIKYQDSTLDDYDQFFKQFMASLNIAFGPGFIQFLFKINVVQTLLKQYATKIQNDIEIDEIKEAIGNDFEVLELHEGDNVVSLKSQDSNVRTISLREDISNFIDRYKACLEKLMIKMNQFSQNSLFKSAEYINVHETFAYQIQPECDTLLQKLKDNETVIEKSIQSANQSEKMFLDKCINKSLVEKEEYDFVNDMETEMENLLSNLNDSSLKLENEITVLIQLPSHKIEDKKLLEDCDCLIQTVKILINKASLLQRKIYECSSKNSSFTQLDENKMYCKNEKWIQGFISASKIVGKNAILLVENVNRLPTKSIKFEEIMIFAKELTKNLAHLIWSSKVKIGQFKDDQNWNILVNYQEEMFQTSKILNEKTHIILKSSHKIYMTIYQENLEVNLTNLSIHQAKLLEMECQIKVLELESQIEKERSKLFLLRKKNYHILDC